MDKLTRLSFIMGILIVSISVAYYFVIFLPQKERDQLNMQKQLQMEKNKKAEALQLCLSDADISYSQNWNNECESEGKLSDECIKLIHETSYQYAKENNFSGKNIFTGISEYVKKVATCSCRLSFGNSDRIETTRTNAKNECFKQYPQ